MKGRLILAAGWWRLSLESPNNLKTQISFNFQRQVSTLKSRAERYGLRVIVTTPPRTRQRMEEKGIVLPETVEPCNPFGLTDYIKLQINASAVLSDSGTITEESSILNFPALNIRDAHDRPEGMEEGSVMMIGLSFDRIFLNGLKILETQERGTKRNLRMEEYYQMPNVSEKVA